MNKNKNQKKKNIMKKTAASLGAATILLSSGGANSFVAFADQVSSDQATQQRSGLEVKTNTKQLEDVQAKAKKLGLNVSVKPTKVVNAKSGQGQEQVKLANADMDNQAKAADQKLNVYANEYEAWKADHKTWEAQKVSNDKAEAEYQNDLKIYNTKHAEFLKADAQYKKDYAAYQAADKQWQVAKAKFDKDTSEYKAAEVKYEKDMSAWKIADAKYQQALKDKAAAEAEFQKAKTKYQADMKVYQEKVAEANKNGVKMDGLNPADISQALVLNSEPQAKLSVEKLATNNVKTTGTRGIAEHVNGLHNVNIGDMDKNTKVWSLTTKDQTKGISGPIAKATYTNLQNSTYKGQKITKIVRTYSDMKPTSDPDWSNDRPADDRVSQSLQIYSNPDYGFWYGKTGSIREKTEFYGADGKKINISAADKDAWLAVSSLNSAWSKDGTYGTPLSQAGHGNKLTNYEAVKPMSNGIAKALTESSVNVQSDGKLDARQASNDWDNNSTDGKPNNARWNGWDVANSGKTIYGTGIIQLTGDPDLEYSLNGVQHREVWALSSTIIPKSTIGERPTPPVMTPVKTPAKPATKPQKPTPPTPFSERPKAPVAPVDVKKPTPPDKLRQEPREPVKPTIELQPIKIYEGVIGKKSVTGDASGIVQSNSDKATSDSNDVKELDLNGATVSAGKEMTYHLDIKDQLPAGRNKLSSITFTDKLPENFKTDDKTISKNLDKSLWNVSLKDGVATYTATKTMLDKVNADTTNGYKIPVSPTMTGMIDKNDVAVKNTFKVSFLEDGEKTPTTTVSNEVETKTPKGINGSVKKTVNGQDVAQVKPGDKNTYELEATIGNQDKDGHPINDSIISDRLEKVIEFNDVKSISSDNKELEAKFDKSKGNVDKDNVFKILGNDTAKYAGQKVKITLDTTHKKDADYSKYLKDGHLYKVPNTATLSGTSIDGNGKITDLGNSNTVYTEHEKIIPKQPVKEDPKNPIEKVAQVLNPKQENPKQPEQAGATPAPTTLQKTAKHENAKHVAEAVLAAISIIALALGIKHKK